MMGRALAALISAALLGVVTAAPASAEVKGRIVGIQPADGEVRVSFTAAGLEPGQSIDLSSVSVSLEGQELESEPAPAAAAAQVARYVMLTIDTSGSMRGPGIEGARQAATAYLAKVPADVRVGLITFSDDAQVVVPLTADRGPIRAAVAALQARGDTALYDAVSLAARSFPQTGNRQILLLSDGADDGSTATLPQVTTLLGQGEAALDAVVFQNDAVKSALGDLTKAAGGRVVSTEETASLSAAFTQAATDLGDEIVVTAKLPDDFSAQEGTVVLTAAAGGQQVSDSALAVGLRQPAPNPAVAQGPSPAQLAPAFLRDRTMLYAALAAVFLGIVLVLGTAVAGMPERNGMAARMAHYTVTGRSAGTGRGVGEGGKGFRKSVMGVAEKAVRTRDLETRLAARLDSAGVALKPAEWLMLHVGMTFCVPLFVLAITGGKLVPTLVALVLAVLGPWVYLKVKKALRTKSFLAQMPDVLQLMSGSLSAGYSLPQAVDAVVRQGNEPVASEFNKALVEARIGAPITDALDDVATRMESQDFSWVVMAIRIQRDVGGNLAEVLSTVAATLRERERLRRQVSVLSAEGRLSAWILGALPIGFALYMLVAKPGYMTPLITDPIGWILLGAMLILMVVGSVWMKKVVTVEV